MPSGTRWGGEALANVREEPAAFRRSSKRPMRRVAPAVGVTTPACLPSDATLASTSVVKWWWVLLEDPAGSSWPEGDCADFSVRRCVDLLNLALGGWALRGSAGRGDG